VQAQAQAAFERRAAQQLEAERALAGSAEHAEQAGVDLAEDLEHRRVAAELGELLGAQHATERDARDDDVLAGEQAVDVRVLPFDRHRHEVGEHRLARRAVAVEHLARLGRPAALGMRRVGEVRVDRAGPQRLLVLAHLAHALQDLLDRGAGGVAHVVALVERHAQAQFEEARHRHRIDAFDVQQLLRHLGERLHRLQREVRGVAAVVPAALEAVAAAPVEARIAA
jgi:hypothetical protein